MEVIRNRPGQFEGLNLTQFAAYFDMSRKRPARHRQTDAETAEAEAENVEPNDGGDETGHGNDESVSELPQQPVVDSGVPGRSYQMRAGNPQMWIIRRCANSDDDGEATRESRHADDANDFGRYTCKEDDEDEGDSQRNADIDEVLTAGAAASISRTPYFEKIKVPGKLPDQDYFGMLSRLNTVASKDFF
ncbi:unnamed protein product [Mucor circinelloides]